MRGQQKRCKRRGIGIFFNHHHPITSFVTTTGLIAAATAAFQTNTLLLNIPYDNNNSNSNSNSNNNNNNRFRGQQQQQQHQHQQCGDYTRSFYRHRHQHQHFLYSNRSTQTFLSSSLLKSISDRGDCTVTAALSTAASAATTDTNSAVVENTRHLPRLYIDNNYNNPDPDGIGIGIGIGIDSDGYTTRSSGSNEEDSINFNGNGNSNSNTLIRFRESVLVPLTANQEHYLLSVMRITNKKRWGKRKQPQRRRQQDDNILYNNNEHYRSSSNSSSYSSSNSIRKEEHDDHDDDDDVDYTGCVRIFNGIDGEWLAKVVMDNNHRESVVLAAPSLVGSSSSGVNQKQRRRKKGRNDESGGSVLECIKQLLPQHHGQHQHPSRVTTPTTIYYNNIQLYLGYLKDKQRRKFVFEKATELGIDGITILDTEYSNPNNRNNKNDNNKNNHHHWDDERNKHLLHVIEASEQCERMTVPSISSNLWPVSRIVDVITDSNNINKVDNQNQNQHYWLICRERSNSSPPILTALHEIGITDSKKIDTTTTSTTIHIVIGPEGGWSPEELNIFSNLVQSSSSTRDDGTHDSNYEEIIPIVNDDIDTKETTKAANVASTKSTTTIPNALSVSSSDVVQFVSLGSTILRAETAAITAVGVVMMHGRS